MQFRILYTHQKTKKRKTWQDGILSISDGQKKATLYDDKNSVIDSLFVNRNQLCEGGELESDKYLVTIEELDQQTLQISQKPQISQQQQKLSQTPQILHKQQQQNVSQKRQTTTAAQTKFQPPTRNPSKQAYFPVFHKGSKPSQPPVKDQGTRFVGSSLETENPQTSHPNRPFTCKTSNAGTKANKLTPKREENQNRSINDVLSLFNDDDDSISNKKQPNKQQPNNPNKFKNKETPFNSFFCDEEFKELDKSDHLNGKNQKFNTKKKQSLNSKNNNKNAYFEENSSCKDFMPLKKEFGEPFDESTNEFINNLQSSNDNTKENNSCEDFLPSNKTFLEPGKGFDFCENVDDWSPDNNILVPDELNVADEKSIRNINQKTYFTGRNVKKEPQSKKCKLSSKWGIFEETDNENESEDIDVFGNTRDFSKEVASNSSNCSKVPDNLVIKHKTEGNTNQNLKVSLATSNRNVNVPTATSRRNFNVPTATSRQNFNVPLANISSHSSSNYLQSRVFPNPFSATAYNQNISDTSLIFPTKDSCLNKETPKRELSVCEKSTSVSNYIHTYKCLLKEHLNIMLFSQAAKFHTNLLFVDITALSKPTVESANQSSANIPSCKHGPGVLRVVKKEGKNKGRMFYTCPIKQTLGCDFFVWANDASNKKSSGSKLTISDYTALSSYMSAKGVELYCLVKFLRKQPFNKFNSNKKKELFRQQTNRKLLYLKLPFKKSASTYQRDDLWVVSKNLDFTQTFIAKSAFYGPNANAEVEILPLYGYSMSNWTNRESCFAIHAFNASTELTCIENLDEHVNARDAPVVNKICTENSTSKSPVLLDEKIEELYIGTVNRFDLNEDQSLSLHRIAEMFVGGGPVTLIHGVFGAGKSYLLSVVILFLIDLFSLLDIKDNILIVSTTNVAVDRVLNGLLDLGFEDFVRVGSVRKISRHVLPYSVHACEDEDQEMKELNELSKCDLTADDRACVRKAIELHKQGVNRRKLFSSRVVGVTCAACTFPYLRQLEFRVQLMDECSQMIEPLSLLPIARFKCHRDIFSLIADFHILKNQEKQRDSLIEIYKLVLVGDPKQLRPAIQNSEPHPGKQGLELTLFERLQQLQNEAIILRTQYRCHPHISEISNRLFYNNTLIDGVTHDDRLALLPWLPTVSFVDVPQGVEQCESDGSYSNQHEVQCVNNILQKCVEHGVDDVGVITQYRSQARKISDQLDNSSTIQVSTVDAFQGAEKEVIILSCVRTRHAGFIDCPRRTNVAVSRAKRHLVIVGNRALLAQNKLWGLVIDICRRQSGSFVGTMEEFRMRIESAFSERD